MRVLIVEDERQLAETVAKGLRRHGLSVDVAFDGVDGLTKAIDNDYAVVLLDRDLPRMHGDEVCRQLVAERPGSRVLMLTAAAAIDDIVGGLSVGADDYLAKPFAFAELLARVVALGRRSGQATPSVLRAGEVELDPSQFRVTRAGTEIVLTSREFAVLHVLIKEPGRVVSAERLLELAWDDQADPFTAAVRVIMSRLRAKLGQPSLIETVVGRGYRLVA